MSDASKSSQSGLALCERDAKFIWHPYTQHGLPGLPLPIARAKDATLYDTSGRPYVDMISSWWVNIHGHGRPEIAEAVANQIRQLDHVHFAGATHEPAVKLAGELLRRAKLPAGSKVFYSDNGSTAVEVALKAARQYWRNQGGPRNRIAVFRGGYHGDTLAAMSAGHSSGFFGQFAGWMFAVETLDVPWTWTGHDSRGDEAKALSQLDALLQAKQSDLAALIVEPLIQGAAGMRFHRPEFLREVCTRVRAAGVLILFDEVMTGFGRTGTFLAAEQCGVCPDMICLSKGLTGGALPMAVTLINGNVFDAFLGRDFTTALAHGHSYTANPVGCAAALASLELFDRTDALKKVAAVSTALKKGLEHLARVRDIAKTRVLGGIAAFEMEGRSAAYMSEAGRDLAEFATKRGVILRPIGNVVYLMPPYCITQPELDFVFDVLREYFQVSR